MAPFRFSPDNAVVVRTRAGWRAWLSRHHTRTTGVWLVTFRQSAGKRRLDYNDAVEEALCFGWIDSTVVRVDEGRAAQYFSPRRQGSGWSQSNKKRIERVVAAGLIEPAGVASIEAAKRDGSWSRLDAAEALDIPRDLASAFRRYAGSARHFHGFPPGVKRGILQWIAAAKRPETRANRIDETARLAAGNLRANQGRRDRR